MNQIKTWQAGRKESRLERRSPAIVLGIAVVAAVTLPILQPSHPAARAAETPGRYTMTPADGGMLKLDSATGAVSFCTRPAGGEWACTPTKDGEQKLRERITGLEAEITALKDQLQQMDQIAGIGDPRKETAPGTGGSGPPGGKPDLKLPTEKDVEQAFDYFERMMKTIRERMKRLEQEGKPSTPL
jgi:hypothetical protein